MLKKKWKCFDCGNVFETEWIPSFLVKCPKCNSTRVYRIDKYRGKGFGRRLKRGICRFFQKSP